MSSSIAPELTLESIDVYSPESFVASVPHDQFELLRTQAPVFKHDDPGLASGFWAVTRYDDVVTISRNPEIFSSQKETCFIWEMEEDVKEQQRLMMVNLDAPGHTRLRTLVNRGFTPRTIGRMEAKVKAACDGIVERAVAQGSGDFVTMCAAELPLVVIADLMGVPYEDRHRVFEWSNRMMSHDDPEVAISEEDSSVAAMETYAYANDLAAQRRACPADDIVTKLISADENGEELSEMEFDLFFIMLMVAGNETTRNAISGGAQAMVENPEQWARLKADPSLARTAADEIVRWVSPVMDFRRTATRDTELGGQKISEGDKVVMYYSAANRDEAVFENANTFDIGRDPNPHIGFGGGGPHFCLGRHLAVMEIELMFSALARMVDHIELTGPVRRLQSNFINGIKEMQVNLVPASAK